MNAPLMVVSNSPIIATATLSRMSIIKSATLHSWISSGRLSIHAGLIIIRIWQMHAVAPPPAQMAASWRALETSSTNAVTVHTSEVPALSGHGGLQSAHAVGAGRPPERALRSIRSHLSLQSIGLPHVMACVVLPLMRVSSTSVRGYHRLLSARPMLDT